MYGVSGEKEERTGNLVPLTLWWSEGGSRCNENGECCVPPRPIPTTPSLSPSLSLRVSTVFFGFCVAARLCPAWIRMDSLPRPVVSSSFSKPVIVPLEAIVGFCVPLWTLGSSCQWRCHFWTSVNESANVFILGSVRLLRGGNLGMDWK